MRDLTNDAQEDQPPLQLDSKTLVTLAFLLGSATTLGASSIYRRFFKRIKNAEWVTPTMLKRKRWITGVVTKCVLARLSPWCERVTDPLPARVVMYY
jgi:hypothetical protein